ncbi:M3 family oligoendopeptidase [Agaribacter marinus]|uniref:M3 family oligoendopeptidase n=1 Tax=Virgibacillus salarius TaxID=447199 RepID=A0A941DSM9_9BACI|nr:MULTISPECIES: M3 family oligoendopeptidase [Bacillaceae]MBR7796419.1 M3 family oligoendopeptidase [Virgibacillus salarius]NAZ09128.1 M3 family oligoendopeptidase [Agaribacter marinus]WBX79744.1 M3 family oligoendopeptidase [Virgibacillus salarius]
MEQTLHPTWDLDVIFPGGSDSKAFHTYLQSTQEEMKNLFNTVSYFSPKQRDGDKETLVLLIKQLEATMKKVREAFAFISCLSAQNLKDEKANLLVSRRHEIKAEMDTIQTTFEQKLVDIPDIVWDQLVKSEDLVDVAYVLEEFRNHAKEQLVRDQEVLINDLAIDGYHAWGQMYDVIIGNMSVDMVEDGETKSYSIGQATNKLTHPNRSYRKQVFQQLDKAWKNNASLFGQTLNHLAGFRLQTYKHRNWNEVLQEPLALNRMRKETLDAMWTAIKKYKHPFVEYLMNKAKLLGLNKLSIYDVGAPVNKVVKTSSFEEGADFIVEHFNQFSPQMADFAKMAFENRWIEAEDRPNKRPGGFCTSFPDSKQTRIFMTYSGTSSNIATLAHELGHAYHQHVMNDVNGLNQRYAMNVAETASTFAEMVVADASVKSARSIAEKKSLLEDKIQRSIAFFMNIHSRFIFERRFYEERKQGLVPVKRLNDLMIEAQKEAYCDALSEYDPNFWASKLHFHITRVPFYNFPYTFGYLFSLGIYAKAQENEDSFEDAYISLLRDTGRMNVEDLAKKHLDTDLTKPEFWEAAIQLCVNDVDEYLSL